MKNVPEESALAKRLALPDPVIEGLTGDILDSSKISNHGALVEMTQTGNYARILFNFSAATIPPVVYNAPVVNIEFTSTAINPTCIIPYHIILAAKVHGLGMECYYQVSEEGNSLTRRITVI